MWLNKLEWMPLQERIERDVLVFMYNKVQENILRNHKDLRLQ